MKYIFVFIVCFSVVDLFAQSDTSSVKDTTVINYFYLPPIQVYKNRFYYQDKKVKNRMIFDLIEKHPNLEKKKKLTRYQYKLQNNNIGKAVFGSIGVYALAFGVPMLIGSEGDTSSALFILGTGVTLSGGFYMGLSQLCRYKSHKKKKQIVELYNTSN